MSAIETTIQGGLARKRLGVGSLVFFTVSASAPMTVLAGGVVATFAVTGVVGVPLSFPILAVALALFSVGYAAMSRYIFNAGAFYSYMAQGLGRAWGVAGSFVALLGYNTIQIGLYGLFGYAMVGFAALHFSGITWAWWVWALIAWAIVGLFGILRIDLNAKVLSVLLVVEVCAVVLFDIGSFGHPAGGSVSFAGLEPKNLFVSGIGGVFAFGIAAFVGFEQGAVYGEETKHPGRTVAKATYIAIAITGVLYTISAWALTVAVGPGDVVKTAQDPNSGVPFSLIQQHFGVAVADVANVLLITSVFAALLSFHNGVARYLYALGRERVLLPALARTGKGSAAPLGGSVIQTGLALVVVVIFAILKRNPLTELFTWLSYVAAVSVLLLMIGTSLAVIGFFRRRANAPETPWQRLIAPIIAAVALIAITWVTVQNSDAVLGTAKNSPLVWILPGAVGLAAVLGLAWGLIIRSTRPEVYRGIGLAGGRPEDEVHEPAWHDTAQHPHPHPAPAPAEPRV